MPVHCRDLGGKYRICESNGAISVTVNGKAVDGGGHESRDKCGIR